VLNKKMNCAIPLEEGGRGIDFLDSSLSSK